MSAVENLKKCIEKSFQTRKFLDRVPGTGESGSEQNMAGTLNQNIPTDNMFTTSREEDRKYEVFPEASMKSEPVYKAAEEYTT